MTRRTPTSERRVFPAVDLGGTKIAFAFMEADERRGIVREYPPTDVVKVQGRTHARRTLERIAELIRERAREVERQGWTVLRVLGLGAPGLHLEDGSVDPRTVPNIPGLAAIRPARFLENRLKGPWKVYIQNDGVVQAMAAAHAFVRSSEFDRKWRGPLRETGGRVIYFGPGTGFGAGKVRVLEDRRVEPAPGSQAFFDLVVRDGETAEALLGGAGIGRRAAEKERANLQSGRPVFLRFTDALGAWRQNPDRPPGPWLDRITGRTAARAYASRDPEARRQASEVFRDAGRDLARLILCLHGGRGTKKLLPWDRDDWRSVKGTRVFLVAGLLTKATGRELILPEARRALEEAGCAGRIHLFEIDRLAEMRKVKDKIGVWGAALIVPREAILAEKARSGLIIGNAGIQRRISRQAGEVFQREGRPVLIAIDGYAGVDWSRNIPPVKKRLQDDGFRVTTIDLSSCFKPAGAIERMIRPCMTEEPTFGRIFGGRLADLLDPGRIEKLRERLLKARAQRPRHPGAVLCFGPGAACATIRGLHDIILYRDVTREEITRRASRGLLAPLGSRGAQGAASGLPAYLAGKRYHYVDFPVLDREKKSLLKHIHYYVDDNLPRRPKLIPRDTLDEMISHLVRGPFRLKAFYDEGVWGGQWLKRVRGLPGKMVNCAWAYELMAYQMSLRFPVADTFLEVPFANLLDREPDAILGPRVRRRFKGLWPIRVNYDDSWRGGDMAIQIHPDAAYVRKWFRESLHQDESYYIMAAAPDAYVHLGLKSGIDLEAFQEAVEKAETRGIPFDHRDYVNVFPARQGDLFLIPAGTVHASGRGCVVLELSATTDRYTFHLYDYLRPDLNGRLREIHSTHAFRMIRKHPERTTPWVKRHLIQKPRCLRRGKDWAEYLLGHLDALVFEVRRLEFAVAVEDETKGVPHVLSVAEGEKVLVQPVKTPDRAFRLGFSETAIVPASVGRYRILNQGPAPCKVLKTIVNPARLAGQRPSS